MDDTEWFESRSIGDPEWSNEHDRWVFVPRLVMIVLLAFALAAILAP